MPVAAEKLETALRKLRKSLKDTPESLSPGGVHRIRTRARRIEAVLHALKFDESRSGTALMGKIAPIRKKAGRVRDMDVLTDHAARLSGERDGECLVRLLEHLGAQRLKHAEKLRRKLKRERKKLRSVLKRFIARSGEEFCAQNGSDSSGNGREADAAAAALALSEELAGWPALDLGNLHAFRLKVKELRYVLQLAKNPDTPFLRSLSDAKDAIGAWHDWQELTAIAAEVLDHDGRCAVRDRIDSHARNEFAHALAVANELRRDFLQGSGAKRPGSRSVAILRQPVVLATTKPDGLKARRAR